MAKEESKANKINEDNIRKLDEQIKLNKKIPKEYRKSINKKVIYNVVLLAVMLIYLISVNISSLYIDTSVYLRTIKVISIILAIISIVYFELGYKKDNENVFLYGIEVFIIALITLFCCYAYELYFHNYNRILVLVASVISIYYLFKILYINRKMKKEYYEKLNDIKEITKKG